MKRKSYNLPNHAHFLTFSCFRRQQLLATDVVRDSLLCYWHDSRLKGRFRILAYVIMPEHVHLLIHPLDEDYKMSEILRRLKEPFSRWIVAHWTTNDIHLLKRIEVTRGARQVRRFWQTGGGYDRNVYTMQTVRKAIEYIEWNPVRRGLVANPDEWRWCSAYARSNPDKTMLTIDGLEALEIIMSDDL